MKKSLLFLIFICPAILLGLAFYCKLPSPVPHRASPEAIVLCRLFPPGSLWEFVFGTSGGMVMAASIILALGAIFLRSGIRMLVAVGLVSLAVVVFWIRSTATWFPSDLSCTMMEREQKNATDGSTPPQI
jgi:hypothetical protein